MFYDKLSSSVEHHLFRLDEFDSIPERAGVYSWHLNCVNNLKYSFHKVYKQKSFKTSLSGFLKERFEGRIQSKALDENAFGDIENDFLKIASGMFAPPVYVGIAKSNLNQRLNSHKRKLQQLLNSNTNTQAYQQLSDEELDTEVESGIFASRLSSIINNRTPKLSENEIFVKLVILNNNTSIEHLKNLEYFLNRTYNPILGRR